MNSWNSPLVHLDMFCYYLLFCWKIDLVLAESDVNLIPSLEQAPTSKKLPLSSFTI